MQIIINNSLYEMSKKEAYGVLKIASEQIPSGIYAIEKDGVIELRRHKIKSKEYIKRKVNEFKKNGFKVYVNGDYSL